jgi:glycosyltransferase involved in cell wall biosynthesis
MVHYVLDARTATPHNPGIRRYVTNLARATSDLLREDEVLTVLHLRDEPVALGASSAVRAEAVDISPRAFAQQWILPRRLRALEADVYHSPYTLMPYRTPVPSVLTLHDLIPIVYPEHRSGWSQLSVRLATRLALWAADRVVVVSESTQKDLLDHFNVAASRVSVIPEAPDPTFYPRPAHAVEDLRARYDLPDHFALYLGSNEPRKNLTRLIEAWARVVDEDPEAVLVVAGQWLPDHEAPRTRADALDLGASNLRWLGAIPGDDLACLYTAATMFVFPSLYEGFGLPPLEAMACGTPVACSDVSSLPEVVGDAAVTFDPTRVDAIAEALLRLWTSPNLLMDLWARGIRRAQRFRWADAARQTIALYRELAGGDQE